MSTQSAPFAITKLDGTSYQVESGGQKIGTVRRNRGLWKAYSQANQPLHTYGYSSQASAIALLTAAA